VGGELEYEVNRILDSQIVRGKVEVFGGLDRIRT
jgi:hypothetical protein